MISLPYQWQWYWGLKLPSYIWNITSHSYRIYHLMNHNLLYHTGFGFLIWKYLQREGKPPLTRNQPSQPKSISTLTIKILVWMIESPTATSAHCHICPLLNCWSNMSKQQTTVFQFMFIFVLPWHTNTLTGRWAACSIGWHHIRLQCDD